MADDKNACFKHENGRKDIHSNTPVSKSSKDYPSSDYGLYYYYPIRSDAN